MASLDEAEVIDYRVGMLPTEGIEAIDLQRIKEVLKNVLQQQVNEALLLFTSGDNHHNQAVYYEANQAREMALKRLKSC